LWCFRHHGQRPNGFAGRVKAQDFGFFHVIAQQGAQRGYFLAHVVSAFAAIDIELKLNHHHRHAFVAA
jgi:hypothetical protein